MRRSVVGAAIMSIAMLLQSGALANDQEIGRHIQRKLIEQKELGNLKGFDVQMKVDQCTVWLTGRVASEEQLQMVLDIASNTSHLGTQQVVNDLQVVTKTAEKSQPIVARTVEKSEPMNLIAGFQLKNPFSRDNDSGAESASSSSRRRLLAVEQQSVVVAEGTGVAELPQVRQAAQAEPVRPPVTVTQAVAQVVPAPVASQPVTVASQPVTRPAPAAAVSHPEPAGHPRMAYVPAYQYVPQHNGAPLAFAHTASHHPGAAMAPTAHGSAPIPAYAGGYGGGVAPAQHDHPTMPPYAWPAYASHPNYAAVTYPQQYSPTAWPYIGPFYPYPQVPLGWRKVTLEWKDGWWFLDFKDRH